MVFLMIDINIITVENININNELVNIHKIEHVM